MRGKINKKIRVKEKIASINLRKRNIEKLIEKESV